MNLFSCDVLDFIVGECIPLSIVNEMKMKIGERINRVERL